MAFSFFLGDTFCGDSCYGTLGDWPAAGGPFRVLGFHSLELDLIRRVRRKDPSWYFHGAKDLLHRMRRR